MGDWFRSVTVLVMAFVGAVVVTIGLANVIVPGGGSRPQGAGDAGGGAAATPPVAAPAEGIGGHLAVTGDREGTMILTQEANEERYSLTGSGSRIVFEGQPPAVAQISWDGLEFFVEPDDCSITPGELDDVTGIGYAEIRCEDLADVRGGETIDLAGRIGVALTLIGESELPDMGGSVAVGDETWEFDEAMLFAFATPAVAGAEDYNMVLTDEDAGTLRFNYDIQTHRLTLVRVERGGETSDLAAGACNLATEELGRMTPTAAVVELTIDCPAADVPGLGLVPITGTLIVQNLEFVP